MGRTTCDVDHRIRLVCVAARVWRESGDQPHKLERVDGKEVQCNTV
jgi:hypothetical protein